MGLVHFGAATATPNDESSPIPTETNGLRCKVDLNPHPKGDHWIEVAFRPNNIQSPGPLNSIISQHGEGSGWEIRCGVRPRSHFVFGGIHADPGGIHVEVIWTTTNGLGTYQHNAFPNANVPLEIGTWYHVVLAYCHETSTLSLYVNGRVVRHQISGDFVPAKGLPRLGQNMHWPKQRFQGWIAFGGGGHELPIHGTNESALDDHVRKLTKARLAKLPKQPALHQKETIVAEEDDVEDSSGVDGEDSCALGSVSSSGVEDSDVEDSVHGPDEPESSGSVREEHD